MSFSVDSFNSKLSALNETQDSIVSVSQWIQFHRRACGPIAQTWYDYIRNIPLKRKLAMIYLANDVVQQSKAKKREEFIEAFASVIVDGIISTYREGNADLRNKIKRVVEVWEQRQVFRPDVVQEINSKMKQLDSSDSAPGADAGGSIGGTGFGDIGGSGLGGIGGSGLGGLGGIGGSGLGGIGGSGLGGLGGIGGSGFGDLGGSSSSSASVRSELQELNTLLGKVKKTTTVTETKSKLESCQKSRDSAALTSLLETVNSTISDISANQKLRSDIDTALLTLKNKQASLLEEDKHNMTMFENMKKEIEAAQKEVSSLVQDTNGEKVVVEQEEEDDNDDYIPQPASEPAAPAPAASEPANALMTVSDEDESDSYEPLPAVAGGESEYKAQPLPSNDFSVPQYDSDSDEDSDAPESKKRKVDEE